MARLPRFIKPGEPQHVILRGNNRDPVFYADEDYQFFRNKLCDASKKHQCAVHAYVLMTNHVHLLVTPSLGEGISKMMQMLGRYYVQYFNHTYERTGTLWEGRYKASLIDSEHYLLLCMRYIELNPVRADMVEHPSEYPWSSYRYNGLNQFDPLVSPHHEYQQLGGDASSRCDAYRSFFNAQISEKSLQEIRVSANKNWVLGSDYFKEKIEKKLNRRAVPLARGGDRKSNAFRNKVKVPDSINPG